MDIKQVLSEMTLEEKASLCSGLDAWHTKEVTRLGVPSVMNALSFILNLLVFWFHEWIPANAQGV